MTMSQTWTSVVLNQLRQEQEEVGRVELWRTTSVMILKTTVISKRWKLKAAV